MRRSIKKEVKIIERSDLMPKRGPSILFARIKSGILKQRAARPTGTPLLNSPDWDEKKLVMIARPTTPPGTIL